MKAALAAALAALTLAAAPTPVLAGEPVPVPDIRLLSGGPDGTGGVLAGLDMRLPVGWHTYWRYPGDAGVPPLLSHEGSENVAAAALVFPAPERYDDGRSISVVYHDRVLFPLKVMLVDPDRPAVLRVGLDYGYCREICVPARADLVLDIDPAATPSPAAAAAIARALARVPVEEADAPQDAPRLVALTRTGEDPRTALLTLDVEASGGGRGVDVFVEPPPGWYITQPRPRVISGNRLSFELPLRGMPKTAAFAGAAFTFTLVHPAGGITVRRTLD